MAEDGVGAALVVVRGAPVFAEEKGMDVEFTAVLVEASVVEVTAAAAAVVGAASVGGSGNTGMVVGFRVVVVVASFVEDCAVVAEVGFSVVGVGNTDMVVGFPEASVVAEASFIVDNGVVGASFAVVVVSDDIKVVVGVTAVVV